MWDVREREESKMVLRFYGLTNGKNDAVFRDMIEFQQILLINALIINYLYHKNYYWQYYFI